LQHPKRKTIGIRVPDHAVPQAMLAELGEPIMSSTLILPGDDMPLTDPEEMRARLEHQVDLSWTAALAAWNRPPWWTSPARRRGCCGAKRGPAPFGG